MPGTIEFQTSGTRCTPLSESYEVSFTAPPRTSLPLTLYLHPARDGAEAVHSVQNVGRRPLCLQGCDGTQLAFFDLWLLRASRSTVLKLTLLTLSLP